MSVDAATIAFLFDGNRIRGDQSPADLDMEDGDEVSPLDLPFTKFDTIDKTHRVLNLASSFRWTLCCIKQEAAS